MAISLKQQLLAEAVHYSPPYIDVTKPGRSDVGTNQAATRLFYDFYAMEFLHRSLGTQPPVPSSPEFAQAQDPMKATKMQKAISAVKLSNPDLIGGAMFADYDNVEFGGSNIVPHKLREVIDNVYEEVTFAIGRKLLQHLRLTCVQELRHLINHASGWGQFRHALVSHYNANGTITKEDFKKLIAEWLPDMVDHEEATKRLLLFCRYYSKMSGSGGNDPADVIAKHYDKKEEPKVAKAPEEEPLDEPDPNTNDADTVDYSVNPPKAPGDDEPDTTDYSAEIPDNPDWEAPTGDFDPEDPFDKKAKKKLHEDYASGVISPSTIKKIFKAIHKAHLTWDDIVLAYNNVPWGGGYGGPKWGSGVVAFLKLMPLAKSQDAEKMAGLIDHIFDLVHNGGNLLNKGGMYIKDNELDRRAKVTHVARYLPSVSPLIKRLIIRVLGYLSGDPEIQKDIGKISNSPTKPFTPEESMELAKAKLSVQGETFLAHVPFQKKKGVDDTKTVDRYYTVKSHTNGMYSASDSLNADVQIFKTFPELMQFVNTTIASEIKSAEEHGGVVPIASTDPKTLYINSHVRTKLTDVDKEQQLLDKCKMGWRKSSKYYKAYFPGDKRFLLYVFSDGSFLTSFSDSNEFQVFQDWMQAFNMCVAKTQTASPYPDINGALAAMGKLKGTIGQPVPAGGGVFPKVAPSKEYHLPASEEHELRTFVGAQGNYGVAPDDSSGMFNVYPTTVQLLTKAFSVGKKLHTASFGKPYKITHYKHGGGNESWTFSNWMSTLTFIKNNFAELIAKAPLSMTSVTPSTFPTGTLPANAASKAAYKVHAGINEPPKHTLRLTVEDEAAMAHIGFEPKMIGQDVWYIHKSAGDTVKFYPNDLAKIIFTKAVGSPVVKKKVEEMLAWLPTKYSATTTTSPVNVSAPKQTLPATAKGISLDTSIFKSKIKEAGFVFDTNTGQYTDGNNTLNIKPDRSSTLTIAGDAFGSGEVNQFKNLPELLAYLANEYPTKKKSKSVTKKGANPDVEKLKELIKLGGFIKVGTSPVSLGQGKGIKYANKDKDVLVVYSSGQGSAYKASTHQDQAFDNLKQINAYLENEYGDGHGGGDPLAGLETGAEKHDGISEGEYESIKAMVAHHGLISNYSKHGPEDNWSSYVTIFSKPPDETVPAKYPAIYTVGALGNYYQINNAQLNAPIKTVNTWPELLVELDKLLGIISGKDTTLPSAAPSGNPNQLSQSEMNLLGDLASNYENLKVHSQFGKVALSAIEEIDVPYLMVSPAFKGGASPWEFGIRKFKDVYEIYRVEMSKWTILNESTNFEGCYDAFKALLDKYIGGSGGTTSPNPTPTTPSDSPNALSESETEFLNKVLDEKKVMTLNWRKGKITGAADKGTKFLYLRDHSKKMDKDILAFLKRDNAYEVHRVIGNTWDIIVKSPSFTAAVSHVESFIDTHYALNNLSEDEKEWVTTFVSSKYPNLEVKTLYDGNVLVSDPNNVKHDLKEALANMTSNNPLFLVGKTKTTGYFVTSWSSEWGNGHQQKTFKTFEQLKTHLATNIALLTALMVTPPEVVEKSGELEDYLLTKGFVLTPQTAQGVTNKGNIVYDNPTNHDRLVVVKANNTYMLYYEAPNHKWKEFADVPSLIEWMDKYYKDITPLEEIHSILTGKNYQGTQNPDDGSWHWLNQHDDQISIGTDGTVLVNLGDESTKLPSGVISFDNLPSFKEYILMKHEDDLDKKIDFFEHKLQDCGFEAQEDNELPDHITDYYLSPDGSKVYVSDDGHGGYSIHIAKGNQGYMVSNCVDAAYIVIEKMGMSAPKSKSFLNGQTGDEELDEMIKFIGFKFDGAKPGDVLGMWFSEPEGAKLMIHDDQSANFTFANPNADGTTPMVSFENYTALKEFLNQHYNSKIASSSAFPSNPALEMQWSQLWNTLKDAGFELKGGNYKVSPKSKNYFHAGNNIKAVVYDNGKCQYVLPKGPTMDFNQYHLLDAYIKKLYLKTDSYAKSYYDDLGESQQAVTIRLTEDDEEQMGYADWVWVPASESQVTSAYVNKNNLKKVVFFNKSLKSNDLKPTATLYIDGAAVIEFKATDHDIPSVVKFLTQDLDKDSKKEPVGGKYSKNYYEDVGPTNHTYGIRLMQEHEYILKQYGFVWRGDKAQCYQYTPNPKQYLVFYNLGIKDVVGTKPAAAFLQDGKTVHSWDKSIAWALEWVQQSLNQVKGGAYSTDYYTRVAPEQDSTTIRLTKLDEETLTKSGYKWVPTWVSGNPNAYVNVMANRKLEFTNLDLANKIDNNKKYAAAFLKDWEGNQLVKWPHIEDAVKWVNMAASPSSTLMYKEAAPIMLSKMNLAAFGAPPHSFDEIKFMFNTNKKAEEGTGEIQVLNGNTVRLSIGKRPHDVYDNMWYIRYFKDGQQAEDTFVSENNLLTYLQKHVVDYLSFEGNVLTPKPEPKNLKVVTDSQLGNYSVKLPTKLDKKASDAGFKSEEKGANIVYVHSSGEFQFQYYPMNGMCWSTDNFAKEQKVESDKVEKFVTDALSNIGTTMNGEEMDKVFSKAALTRKQALFDKMLRMAKRMKGGSLSPLTFHTEMLNKGFEYNEFDECYMNEEINQVVVVTPELGHNKFHLLYISPLNKEIVHTVIENKSNLMVMIGMDGDIVHTENNLKNTKQTPPGPFSNEDYNTHPNDDNLDNIKLNAQDTEALSKIGFDYDENKECYIKHINENETPALQEAGKKKKKGKKHISQQFELPFDKKGDDEKNPEYEVVATYNTGQAIWTRTEDTSFTGNELESKQGEIKEILEFVWHRWSGDATLGQGDIDEPDHVTPLNKKVKSASIKDFQQLEEFGFKQVPKETVPSGITKQNIVLTYYKEQTKEYIQVFNDGSVRYGAVTGENTDIPYTNFTSMAELLEYFAKFNDGETGNDTWEEFSKDLEELGFVLQKGETKAPVYWQSGYSKMTYYNDETKQVVQIMKDGTVRYGKWDGTYFHPVQKFFDSVKSAIADFSKPTQTYEKIDFFKALSNGTNSYFTAPENWLPYQPYSPKKDPQSQKFIGKFNDDMLDLGFVWDDTTGLYRKNWNTNHWQAVKNSTAGYSIHFYQDPKTAVRKYFIDNDVDKVLQNIVTIDNMAGSPQDPSNDLFNPLNYPAVANALEAVDIELNPKDKAAAEAVGFHEIVKNEDIVYAHSNGDTFSIDNHGWGSYFIDGTNGGNTIEILFEKLKAKYNFASGKQWKAPDPTMKPPTISKKMPWSDFNYLDWAAGEIQKGTYNGSETIQLVPDDEATMGKLGFHLEYTGKDKEPKYSNVYYDHSEGQAVIFRVNGMSEFTTNGGGKTTFNNPKSMIQWLWDNKPHPDSGNDPDNMVLVPANVSKAKGQKPKEEKMPYSGKDYSKIWKSQQVPKHSSIQLVSEDDETMAKMGFKPSFVPGTSIDYQHAYAKGDERMFFFADGTAKYWPNEKGYTHQFETVEDAMQFLWDGTPKKTGAPAGVHEWLITKGGFEYNKFDPNNIHYSKMDTNGDFQMITFYKSGEILYQYEKNGLKKQEETFNTTQELINKIKLVNPMLEEFSYKNFMKQWLE